MAAVDLSLDLYGQQARIRVTGYLNLQAGRNLSVLLRDLGRMGSREIQLDIAECSPICIRALECLLEAKFCLAHEGVSMVFSRRPQTVSKVFRIMGLGANGELVTGSDSRTPRQPTSYDDV